MIFLGLSIFTSIVSLTLPSFVNSLLIFSTPSIDIRSCILLAVEGAISGIFIGLIKKTVFFKMKLSKNLFQEIFTFNILKIDPSFVSNLIISFLIASIVGWIAGAGGATGLFSYAMNLPIDNLSPLGVLVQNGGAGGVGGGGGILQFLFILVILLIQGLIIGMLSGILIGVIFGAISGAIKGGVAEIFFDFIDKGKVITKNLVLGSLKRGLKEGMIVGGIVGLVEGIINAIKLHH